VTDRPAAKRSEKVPSVDKGLNMKYSKLSNDELSRALIEGKEAIFALEKYQKHLATGAGHPTNDEARAKIMESSLNLLAQINDDVRVLDEELARRS
jgi:hypothetical protein